jgi:hypothetical protein
MSLEQHAANWRKHILQRKPFRSDMWLSGQQNLTKSPANTSSWKLWMLYFDSKDSSETYFNHLETAIYMKDHESSLRCYLAPSARISKDFR